MDYIPKMPFRKLVSYSLGMAGWSIMINILSVMLIYFYLPPSNSGLNPLIPQTTFFGIINIIALIAAGGRLFDAVTDPLIAWLSDRARYPRGRRIPFMRLGFVPSFVFLAAIFIPMKTYESDANIIWLIVTVTLFYLALTIYMIPFNALMPELAHTESEKLKFSTALSLAYIGGIILAAQTPLLADIVEDIAGLSHRIHSFQTAIVLLALLAAVFMLIPAYAIDEKAYTRSSPSNVNIFTSLKHTLWNRNFRLFLFADFAYFMALAIISSGMLYYIKVLLGLPESVGSKVFGVLVVVSLLFYPLVLELAHRVLKKYLISGSLILLGVVFLGIFNLGRFNISPPAQIYLLAMVAAVPAAFLGILPYAIISEVAQLDGIQTGQNKEGMYFAVRTFFYKLGMTAGIMLFATFTLWGKDPGDDMGIRLNGLAGFVLCTLAGVFFLGFRERKIVQGIRDHLKTGSSK